MYTPNNGDWRPTASLPNLAYRGEVLWRLRSFFKKHEFLEVHVPILSRDTVVDRHIDPVKLPAVNLSLSEDQDGDFFLQTSPEFGMKRLVCAGMQSIYQIGSVFRAGERGANHNPEFTMVEWYRVGDDLAAAVNLLSQMIVACLEITAVPEVLTYQRVVMDFASVDPLEASIEQLAQCAAEAGIGVDKDWSTDRDDWLNLIFAEIVQPRLGKHCPTIVTHYPATQSALAKIAEDGVTAERFELFIDGVELANGYHELVDADELRLRDTITMQQRTSDGKAAFGTLPGRLLAAMDSGMPACSGCALGLDRLLMVGLNARSIDEVLAFPIERA